MSGCRNEEDGAGEGKGNGLRMAGDKVMERMERASEAMNACHL